MRDQRRRDAAEEPGEVYQTGTKPGAVTLTQHLPVQRKSRPAPPVPPSEGFSFLQAYHGSVDPAAARSLFPDEPPTPWLSAAGSGPVQMRAADGSEDSGAVHAAAAAGTSGSAGALPHLDAIQPLFGKHDVSSVRAYTDGAATQGAQAIGAEAYAVGDQVAFAGAPTLHTAAHEAAHVVQQRAGVSLKGGVGEAGDRYEHHADAVADKVVRGESAEALLDEMSGASTGAAGVQRTPGVMRPDPARPERTRMQITGRYEAEDPGGGNRITLELNQAGTHFEGWWQRRVSRFASGARMEHKRIAGDLVRDSDLAATFRYERWRDPGPGTPGAAASPAGGSTQGTLTATRGGDGVTLRLVEGSGDISVRRDGSIDIDEWSHSFTRTSEAPRLSGEGLASLPPEARAMAQASEDAPLDSDEEGRLDRNVEILMGRIRGWLDAPRGMPRAAHASGIDELVDNVFGQYATEQHVLVRQRLHEALTRPTYASGSITRPYWDWLAVIVATNQHETARIQSRLGITASGLTTDPGAPQNQYSWTLEVVGLAGDVGVGLGGFLGRFTIEQTAGGATWRTDYFTMLGQGSGGLSAGVTVGMRTSNTFQSPFPWRSGNFRGSYTITGAAAGGAVGDMGGAGGVGFINFYGDGTFPVISGDAGGFTELAGLYIGGEMSVGGGYLFGGRDEAIRHARTRAPSTVSGTYSAATAAHFAVDDPALTPLGLQEIRRTCALQRAMLTNRNGSINVVGYTSTTGSDAHNLTLSRLRAQNTLQAIRDVMGSDLAVPQDRQTSSGLGEAPARAAGVPDRTESEPWRKVEVSFDGTVVLTLHF
jgi:outer membrane protein OmpA-like peptidoglycan-associated protein